jgi:hypothetical protein
MSARHRRWPRSWLVAVVATVVVASRGLDADPPKRVALVVIVGPKSEVSSLSTRTLASLYLARPVDDLAALNRPARSAERMAFDAQVLGMNADEVGRYWVDQEVRGERGAPRAIADVATIAKLVIKFPNALGYARLDQLPKGVVIVKLDGKLPSDPGYALWMELAP